MSCEVVCVGRADRLTGSGVMSYEYYCLLAIGVRGLDLVEMIGDIIFVDMRTQGTKYDRVNKLPNQALPISVYAHEFNVSSSAYVHVKYDRHKFGYANKVGTIIYTPHPGYDIVDFHGTCYVINYNK